MSLALVDADKRTLLSLTAQGGYYWTFVEDGVLVAIPEPRDEDAPEYDAEWDAYSDEEAAEQLAYSVEYPE